MALTVDGASIAVLADLAAPGGAERLPFILDEDQLDVAGSILTPAVDALRELTAETIGVDGTWGASDYQGPLTVPEAGTMSVELYDPDRGYDPSNPQADTPAIGRLLQIRIDGTTIWAGRITRVQHDWMAFSTVIEAEDALAEASRQGVSVQLARTSTLYQMVALASAAGWYPGRFLVVGTTVRDRDAELFTGSLLEGLQRVGLAELGALYADTAGRLIFRTAGEPPASITPRATVGLEPGVPVTTIASSDDSRFVNAVYIEPAAGPTDVYRDAASVSAYGEIALEIAATDLLLV
jgi:hypothetical protein